MTNRVDISERRLEAEVRKMMEPRARRALAIYSRQRRAYDRDSYPFAQHEHRSVRDSRSQSIRPVPGGIRISVEAEGASYEEFGNRGPGNNRTWIYPKNGKLLRLPLRGGVEGRKRKRVMIGDDGRVYLAQERVHTYRGRHLLEKSVRMAFGQGFTVSSKR